MKKVDPRKIERFNRSDYTPEERARFEKGEYTEEDQEIFHRQKLSDRSAEIVNKKSDRYGNALKANVESARRKYWGHYTEPKYAKDPNNESEVVRGLDPTGAKYEDAGDLVSAANSRVAQAIALTSRGNKNYWSAGVLYAAAGEYGKAIDSYQKYLKQGGNPQISIEQTRGQIKNLEGKLEAQQKRIERKRLTSLAASILGIFGSLFFFSLSLTGNAIADLTTKTTSFLGAGLLIVGLVAGIFYISSKKKK